MAIAQLEWEFELNGQLLKHSVFRKCIIYIDMWDLVGDPSSSLISNELKLISFDVRMFGGKVVNEMTNCVTHVICDPTRLERVTNWKERNHSQDIKFFLCGPDWVTDSISKGQMVEERPYLPLS